MRGFGSIVICLCVACASSAPPPTSVQAIDVENRRPPMDGSPPDAPRAEHSLPEQSPPEPSVPDAAPSGAVAPTATAPPPEPPLEPFQPGATALEVRECSARGGTIQPVCMSGHLTCVVRYRDGGKRCTDKRDCIGECLYDGSEPEPAPATAVGSCQRTNDPCGCRAKVTRGSVQSTVCID